MNLSLIAGVLACAAGPWPGSTDEPSYRGRSPQAWARRALDNEPGVRREALEALKALDSWEMDAGAVPLLRRALDDADPQVRARACEALFVFNTGPRADALVAQLIKDLQSKEAVDRHLALQALWRLQPAAQAAVPAVVQALGDPVPAVADWAAITLGRLGAEPKRVVPRLIRVLRAGPTWGLREIDAAEALGVLGPAARDAVPALAEAVAGDHDAVRGPAALALARIGPPAKEALPALRRATRDNKWEVRAHAALAVWRVGRDAREAAPLLAEVVKSRRMPPPRGLRWALMKPLLRCVAEEGPPGLGGWTLREVLRALGEMGPSAKDALPVLLPLLKDRDDGVRWWAGRALKKIDPDAARKAGL